jgi:hypothetical protein
MFKLINILSQMDRSVPAPSLTPSVSDGLAKSGHLKGKSLPDDT